MSYVDRLAAALESQLRFPWAADRAGGERVWFLVFEPEKLRQVMAHRPQFRLLAQEHQRHWVEYDVSDTFGHWMANHRHAASYFARPNRATSLPDDFAAWLGDDVRAFINQHEVDADTLLVLTGTEALFGIARVSHITRLIEDAVPGRLLVFFPGVFDEPQYKFLDARDGWNYLAVPILPMQEGGRR